MNKVLVSVLGLVTLGLAAPAALGQKELIPSTLEGGNLYVYAVGQDQALWRTAKKYGAWQGWERLGGKISGSPDACSSNPGRVVVMLRAQDNTIDALVHNPLNGTGAWYGYGSKVGSDPSVACGAGDRLSLFVRGHNNSELYATGAEGGVWASLYGSDRVPRGLAIEDVQGKASQPVKKSLWEKFVDFHAGPPFAYDSVLGASGLGGQIKGSPDGTIFGTLNSPRQAVFVRGMDDSIWWRVTDKANKKWMPFNSLGGLKMSSDPTAIPWKNGGILLFARGLDNALWVRQYRAENQQWTAWFSWGGTLAGSPDATTWGGNRVDVFARAADGSVLHAWREDDDVLAPGAPLGDGAGRRHSGRSHGGGREVVGT